MRRRASTRPFLQSRAVASGTADDAQTAKRPLPWVHPVRRAGPAEEQRQRHIGGSALLGPPKLEDLGLGHVFRQVCLPAKLIF